MLYYYFKQTKKNDLEVAFGCRQVQNFILIKYHLNLLRVVLLIYHHRHYCCCFITFFFKQYQHHH